MSKSDKEIVEKVAQLCLKAAREAAKEREESKKKDIKEKLGEQLQPLWESCETVPILRGTMSECNKKENRDKGGAALALLIDYLPEVKEEKDAAEEGQVLALLQDPLFKQVRAMQACQMLRSCALLPPPQSITITSAIYSQPVHQAIISYVRTEFLGKNKLKDAQLFVEQSGLVSGFTYEELVLPLLEWDKNQKAEDHLWLLRVAEEQHNKLHEAVTALGKKKGGSGMAIECLNQMDKPIIKEYPELIRRERKNFLGWIVGVGNAREIGPAACQGDKDAQHTLLELCTGRHPKWLDYGVLCEKFGMTEDPRHRQRYQEKYVSQEAQLWAAEAAKQAEDTKGAYRLPHEVKVVWVSKPEHIEAARQHLLQKDGMVGLDSESTPNLDFAKVPRLNIPALLQVSTGTHAFLFDLLESAFSKDINQLLCEMMERKDILKIGFKFAGDLEGLGKSSMFVDTCWTWTSTVHALLDLDSLNAKTSLVLAQQHPSQSFSSKKKKNKPQKQQVPKKQTLGLSEYVESLLGAKLDKTQQKSYWARRPLNEKQLQYAASDAFVLLSLYAAMKEKFEEENSSEEFDELVKESLKSCKPE